MRPRLSILDALSDPHIFASHFKGGSWTAWRMFLASLFGIPLNETERRLFARCTGRRQPNAGGDGEAWLVCGRRVGKSFMLAVIAVFIACFRDWRPYLGPGERGTVIIVCADRKQARVVLRYIKGLLADTPMLARLIEAERAEAIDLKRRISIEVMTASFRSTRGYSVVAALCDEVAFWRSEDSSNPDEEIIAAIRPSMATIPGAMLLCALSPYARRGLLWNEFKRNHGPDGNLAVLVWHAPTKVMNPSLPDAVISDALERDYHHARAKYFAEFRSDVETFMSLEAVQACVAAGVFERRPSPHHAYRAFCDPSGGSSDSMTLAIAHKEGDVAVLDCVREVRAPFAPDFVVKEFAALLASYSLSKVEGDRYAASWVVERFKAHGISYAPATRSRSDLYLAFLPAVNSRSCRLLNSPRLINQLTALERRTTRGSGRDVIDHPPGAHDDVANAVAGVIANLLDRPTMETAWAPAGSYLTFAGSSVSQRIRPPRRLTAAEGMAIQRPYNR